MNQVVIISGKAVVIDQKHLNLIEQYKWCVGEKLGYVQTTQQGKTIYLHRLIAKASNDDLVDHINRNRLDCREVNLRLVNNQQNTCNRGPNKNQPYKGVGFHKRAKKWRAEIRYQGQYYFLGYHPNVREALVAYNTMAKFLFGEYAYLNSI